MPRKHDKVDAIILAGGQGTRLQSVVSDVPKPLAPVNGRPFLDYQLEILARCGQVRRVVLAVGHLAEKVQAHYAAHPPMLPLEIVVETELLGTGGGLANALGATEGSRVLALNGDSVFRWDLSLLHDALDRLDAVGQGAAIGLVQVDNVSRYGGVDVSDERITAFHEKRPIVEPGVINGGVYLFERPVLAALGRGRVISLEHEVFPALASQGRLAAAIHRSDFIDIGLPETYAAAATILPELTR